MACSSAYKSSYCAGADNVMMIREIRTSWPMSEPISYTGSGTTSGGTSGGGGLGLTGSNNNNNKNNVNNNNAGGANRKILQVEGGPASSTSSTTSATPLVHHFGPPVIQYHSHSHTHLVPLIMSPASTSTLKKGGLNHHHHLNDASEIEMVVLRPSNNNPNNNNNVAINTTNSPTIPCRLQIGGTELTPPTTSCVPWLRKIKVLKKIQRRIVRGRTEGISPNNLPPLKFHNVHGDNIAINQTRNIARRVNSFCKAIAFSDRPVRVNEKIYIRFVEVLDNWSGVLRIGFSARDPQTLRNCLPRYLLPDLAQRPGFWAKGFESAVDKNGVLSYYVDPNGNVHVALNGEDKGIFFDGVDTRGPLWAVLDVYGNTTALEFMDPRAHLNNSRRSILSEYTVLNREEMESRLTEVLPPLNGLKISDSLPAVPSSSLARLEELSFHRVRGKNVMQTTEALSNVAFRRPGEYCQAYAFTSRPIQPNETVIVQVLRTDIEYHGSMAFGLTSCNPQSISGDHLPDDSDKLLDRQEYWVVKKDVANPDPNDVLAFTLNPNGEVTMSINGGPSVFQMNVDISVPLWAFFDLYGTTEGVRCVGSIKHYTTTQQQSQSRPAPPPSLLHQRSVSMSGPPPPSSKSFSTTSSSSPSPPPPTRGYSSSNISKSSKQEPVASTSMMGMGMGTMPKASSPTRLDLSHSPNSLSASTSAAAFLQQQTDTSSAEELPNWSIECVACCERPVDSVFYSCGHMCMCYSCAIDYWRNKEKGGCPICRQHISDVIRTYKS